MKTAKMLGLATGLMLIGAPAVAQSSGEIGYSEGSLGYDALMAGDNETALEQLERSQTIRPKDPALQINLGSTYARMGRYGDAAVMFMKAMNNNRSFDVVLADGRVISSRRAAEMALSSLNNDIASR